jgi:hypothetical protein
MNIALFRQGGCLEDKTSLLLKTVKSFQHFLPNRKQGAKAVLFSHLIYSKAQPLRTFRVGLEKGKRPGSDQVRSLHPDQAKGQTGRREKLEEKLLGNTVNPPHLLDRRDEEASSGLGFKVRIPDFDLDDMGKKAAPAQGKG